MLELVNTLIYAVSVLAIPAMLGAMIVYFPTRREFAAHEKLDDTRFQVVKESHVEIMTLIRETKADLIRELKNGRS